MRQSSTGRYNSNTTSKYRDRNYRRSRYKRDIRTEKRPRYPTRKPLTETVDYSRRKPSPYKPRSSVFNEY